jgi:hypothetical protein
MQTFLFFYAIQRDFSFGFLYCEVSNPSGSRYDSKADLCELGGKFQRRTTFQQNCPQKAYTKDLKLTDS